MQMYALRFSIISALLMAPCPESDKYFNSPNNACVGGVLTSLVKNMVSVWGSGGCERWGGGLGLGLQSGGQAAVNAGAEGWG